MRRHPRVRTQPPQGVPWPLPGEPDIVAVDTTWGEVQPWETAPAVRTIGELELIDLVDRGAALIDCRVPESAGGVSIPGAINVPHGEMLTRRADLDPVGQSILFCNGPQCPQSPWAIHAPLVAGFPARALIYYRGGMHDWVTLGMPTQSMGTPPG